MPFASPGALSLAKKYSGRPLYVTWRVPSSSRVIVPSLPVSAVPPVGLAPAGTVSAGHFWRQASVHALLPLSLTSFVNVYTVMPFEPATRIVPADPTGLASTVRPPVAPDDAAADGAASDGAASEAATDGAAIDGAVVGVGD